MFTGHQVLKKEISNVPTCNAYEKFHRRTRTLKMVHYKIITIYPVMKNSRDVISKFASSLLDIFFSRNIFKTRELNEKFY